MNSLANLFDTADFPPRWQCGQWTSLHGWLHVLADLGIWSAYFAIPCVLLFFGLRRKDLPFRKVFFLFGGFILLCGTTHLMEAVIFWWPAYRLAALVKVLTAVISWITVLALVPIVPQVLAMRSPEELEREIAARQRAEAELQEANAALEQRVRERTAELVRSNDALHQEREWLRTTLASIGDGVIATDADGRIRFLNRVAEALTGWSETAAGDRPLPEVFRLVEEGSGRPVDCPIKRALREGVAVSLTVPAMLVGRDGGERPVDDSAAPIRDGAGTVRGAVLVFRDNSEGRKRDRRRAARLAVTQILAQAASPDEALPRILQEVCEGLQWDVGTFWDVDPQGPVLRCRHLWHRPAAAIVQFEAACRSRTFARGDTLPGRVWRDGQAVWVPDVTRDPQFGRTAVAVREGLRAAFACPVSLHHDVLGVVEFFSRDIREPDADLLEMMSTLGGQIGQFLQRRRAEAGVREAEERTRSVVEHVVDGVVTIDEAGRIDSFNPAAERLFGYQAGEVLGRNVSLLMPQPYSDQHDGFLARYLQTGQARIIGTGREVLGLRKDGSTFPLELSVSEFVLHGRRFFTGILRDISERKRNEDELREIAAKLSEADRRKTEFLATLAHELRNPLAPIRTGLELLKMAQGDHETLEQTRAIMERQTRKLISLVDDLLDVSRITRGKLELRRCHVSLADVVQSAVEASIPLIQESGHALTIELPDEPVLLDADPNRLAQVLTNLLNNAAKYTPEGGRIVLTGRRDKGEVLLAVQDNGLGIPPEMLGRIFEMFVQIDRPLEKGYTGLGIGLTLVKSLVEMHGGQVEVRSAGPDHGSTFTVRLPALAPLPSPVSQPGAAGPAPARPLRVLVVDDNKSAVDMLGLVVRMLGNEVRTAGDGREAITVASDFRPHVVLMDLGMPRMNGYEAARHIRQQPWGQHMVLVALTGWGQDEDKRRTKEAGFDHHLVKPAEPVELQRILAATAEHRPG